ncbi:MAG: DNA-directed DNA polymerase II small subunit [Nitrososphaerales archaeon]
MSSKIAEAINEALSNGYQIHPDALILLEAVKEKVSLIDLVIKTIEMKRKSGDQQLLLLKKDFEEMLPEHLKEHEEVKIDEIEPEIEIVKDVSEKISPSEELNGLKNLFESRFNKLYSIVKERPDSHQIQKIESIAKGNGLSYKVAGLVLDKKIKRTHIELTIDDKSGKATIFVKDQSVMKQAMSLSLDQLVVVDLESTKKGVLFAKSIYSPDIPDRSPNLSKKIVYAIFTSDLHIGSKTFLYEAFERFVLWLTQHGREDFIVKRIKYLIIGGDVVDGIGVYPDQEDDLEELNIYQQYVRAAQLLNKIPKSIQIFIIPGNHDPARQALPQPAIPKKYAEPLYKLENVRILGNPSQIRLHGVNILIYHGRSLDDIVATIPNLTFSKPASAMKILLKARHLAPLYGGRTPIALEKEDHLVIEEVPDIFHAGHVHTLDIDRYKGTLLINSGTWQTQTKYQANMGVTPTPGLLPIVNLATLDVLVKDFTKYI